MATTLIILKIFLTAKKIAKFRIGSCSLGEFAILDGLRR
jgi:hypothetical protein